MEDLIEAYLSVYEESDVAERTKKAVEHQRKGTHGDDHEMKRESEESTEAVKKATRHRGPIVTPSLPESVDLYDVVLDHLLDEGYADTEENAITIMANMSEEWIDEILDEAKVDAGLSDDEKRTARSERGTVGYMHPFTRKDKKTKGQKPLGSTGKYFQMQHTNRQNRRERDADEQKRRDRGAMSRGTWDRD